MASIDFVLDTNPMADEISSVSRHVSGTTTAVVAMQSAVVAAEKEASDRVCSNVNRGFFTLIRSQISQKMAKLQSEIDSHLMRLNSQRKMLLTIKSRMEHDYNTICYRYQKLFNSINMSCRQQIYQLDSPSMDFVNKDIKKISNRVDYLTATVPVEQIESLSVSQKIVSSAVKTRGAKVIQVMSNFVNDMNEQRRLTQRILLTGASAPKDSTHMIPVIINETVFDKNNNTNTEFFLSDGALNNQNKALIINSISNEYKDMHWGDDNSSKVEVANEFKKLLANASTSDRIKNMIIKMFVDNHYKTLKNN